MPSTDFTNQRSAGAPLIQSRPNNNNSCTPSPNARFRPAVRTPVAHWRRVPPDLAEDSRPSSLLTTSLSSSSSSSSHPSPHSTAAHHSPSSAALSLSTSPPSASHTFPFPFPSPTTSPHRSPSSRSQPQSMLKATLIRAEDFYQPHSMATRGSPQPARRSTSVGGPGSRTPSPSPSYRHRPYPNLSPSPHSPNANLSASCSSATLSPARRPRAQTAAASGGSTGIAMNRTTSLPYDQSTVDPASFRNFSTHQQQQQQQSPHYVGAPAPGTTPSSPSRPRHGRALTTGNLVCAEDILRSRLEDVLSSDEARAAERRTRSPSLGRTTKRKSSSPEVIPPVPPLPLEQHTSPSLSRTPSIGRTSTARSPKRNSTSSQPQASPIQIDDSLPSLIHDFSSSAFMSRQNSNSSTSNPSSSPSPAPITPPSSPPFDALTASLMLRDREGYVSFSDVAGLGEPVDPAGDDDDHEEGSGKGSGRNWWGLLGLVRA